MLEKILVGYGADQAGRDAVVLAAQIAMAVDGRLTVVFPYRPLLTLETHEEAQERVESEVRKLLQESEPASLLERLTYRWSPSSWPIRALHELADYEKGSLIVLGAARDDLGDRLRVSLMERMVHGAPCAVAVAPEGYARAGKQGLKRIGVGFSSSKEGKAAIELARKLAGLVGGSVNVIAGAGLEPALAGYAFSSPSLGEVEEEIFTDTEETLALVCKELSEADGVPIEHQTIHGDPASILVECSAELDLLVLGSRAYGPMRHALLGGVSAKAMREARCPVLVIPRGVKGGDGIAEGQAASASRLG